jgi:hypothetical protein
MFFRSYFNWPSIKIIYFLTDITIGPSIETGMQMPGMVNKIDKFLTNAFLPLPVRKRRERISAGR